MFLVHPSPSRTAIDDSHRRFLLSLRTALARCSRVAFICLFHKYKMTIRCQCCVVVSLDCYQHEISAYCVVDLRQNQETTTPCITSICCPLSLLSRHQETGFLPFVQFGRCHHCMRSVGNSRLPGNFALSFSLVGSFQLRTRISLSPSHCWKCLCHRPWNLALSRLACHHCYSLASDAFILKVRSGASHCFFQQSLSIPYFESIYCPKLLSWSSLSPLFSFRFCCQWASFFLFYPRLLVQGRKLISLLVFWQRPLWLLYRVLSRPRQCSQFYQVP